MVKEELWLQAALCFAGSLLVGTLFGNEVRWLSLYAGTSDAGVIGALTGGTGHARGRSTPPAVLLKMGANAQAGAYYTETSCADMFRMTSDASIDLHCDDPFSNFTPEHGGKCRGYPIVHGGCFAPETGRFDDPLCRGCNQLQTAARFWATGSDVRSRRGFMLHPDRNVVNLTAPAPPPLPPLSATKPAHSGPCSAAAAKELGQGAYHILEPGWPVDDLVWVPASGCDMQPLSIEAALAAGLPEVKQDPATEPVVSSILLMGDSHMRNLFSAFVAGLRGVKYGIEGHTEARAKSNSGLVYQLVILGDGRDAANEGDYTATDKMWYVKPMSEFAEDPSEKGMAQTLRCSQAKPGDRCLNIIYSWAPFYTWQKGFLMHIAKQPTNMKFGLVITTAGNYYERKEKDPLPEHWTKYLTWWTAHVGAGHLTVVAWSYSGQYGFIHDGGECDPNNTRMCSVNDPRPAAIDAWVDKLGHASHIRQAYWVTDQVGLPTIKRNQHTMCVAGQNFPKPRTTVTGIGNCTNLPDTFNLRAILTNAIVNRGPIEPGSDVEPS